nr:unnamed protein product [Mus musculus]
MATSLKDQTSEETQVSKDVEEPCSSSQLLMASNQDDPEDETASTSRGLQHPYDSSSESAEGLDNQEVQGSPVIPPDQSDSTDLPVMTVDGKVDFLVNYMLYKYQVKEMMSMNDIMTLIVREDEDRFHEILMRASERVEMVFGLDVKEVDPINHCYALFIKLGLKKNKK